MSGTFPDTLVAFNAAAGSFTPANLFAGEADIITDRAEARAGMHFAKHTVIAQDADGYMVIYDPATRASLALTFSGTGTANDTVTVNTTVFTLKAAAATDQEVTIGATAAETAANLMAVLNKAVNVALTGCFASVAGAVVTVTAIVGGTAGNSIAVAESGTGASWAGGGVALANGSATRTATYGKAIGVALEPVAAVASPVDCPYYSGGIFNHEALIFPAAESTLAARRAAFAGTNINVAALL